MRILITKQIAKNRRKLQDIAGNGSEVTAGGPANRRKSKETNRSNRRWASKSQELAGYRRTRSAHFVFKQEGIEGGGGSPPYQRPMQGGWSGDPQLWDAPGTPTEAQ